MATCVITTVAYHALMVPYYNKLEAHERKEVGLGTIGLIGDGVGTFVGVLFFCCCLVTFSPRRVDQLSLERAQQAQKEAVAWAEAQQGADFIQISIAPTIAERELQVTVSKNHYVSHLIAQLPYQQSTTSQQPAAERASNVEIVFGGKPIGDGKTCARESLGSHGVENGAILQLANALLDPNALLDQQANPSWSWQIADPELPEPVDPDADDFIIELGDPDDLQCSDIYSIMSYTWLPAILLEALGDYSQASVAPEPPPPPPAPPQH